MWRFLAAPSSSDGASSDRLEQPQEGSIPFHSTLISVQSPQFDFAGSPYAGTGSAGECTEAIRGKYAAACPRPSWERSGLEVGRGDGRAACCGAPTVDNVPLPTPRTSTSSNSILAECRRHFGESKTWQSPGSDRSKRRSTRSALVSEAL